MARDARALCLVGIACALSYALLWPALSMASPYRITGAGFATDGTHPRHPGDFLKYSLTARITFDPVPGEALITLESTPLDYKGEARTVQYHYRRGRIFQVDEKGGEVLPEPYRDISAAAVAALHPALLAAALRERPECVRPVDKGMVFAWNDELWSLDLDSGSPRSVMTLRYDFASYTYGDQTMEVRYEGRGGDPLAFSPGRVVVTTHGREVMKIDFTATEPAESTGVATGDRKRDRQWLAPESELVPQEIAPHVFKMELTSLNMRVFIAEFKDYLMVFEGPWDPRNSDPIAAAVRRHFKKPIRYFAFSHIHSQYIAGTRSWVHEGATVLVPPTTAPLIEAIVAEGRRLRPDALLAEPRPLRMETVAKRRRIEDRTNVAEVHNIESDHTDEYLIVYFPKQRVLLTGDLLFYFPGKKLAGRSLKLCETVRKLGLKVDTYIPTWPIEGYGTKNIVTAAEMREACTP